MHAVRALTRLSSSRWESASPEKAAEACRQVAGSVDGLGLNLGCSGLFSVQGGMESALLENPSTEGDSCRDSRAVAVWHKACLGGPLHGTPLEQAEGPERGAEVV